MGIGCIQADIMYMERFSPKLNKGYEYLLVCIDVFSRYCWVEPLKERKANQCVPLIKKIREIIRKLRNDNGFTFTTDEGKEFYGEVSQYLNNENIKRFWANPKDNTKNRTYIVERMNRTI
jgi:IS30 family transposase